MIRKTIHNAVQDSLISKKLFIISLKSYKLDKKMPREDRFSIEIANNLPLHFRKNNLPQYFIKDNSNISRYIDFVQFKDTSVSFSEKEIQWALEAKHYSPHQNINRLEEYINQSLEGILSDIGKLNNCRITNKYILSIQTQIVKIISSDRELPHIIYLFPFIGTYLGQNMATIQSNIDIVKHENRINNFKKVLRKVVDNKLIYDFCDNLLVIGKSTIQVRVNYFVCKAK
jgi:hypothetical protein